MPEWLVSETTNSTTFPAMQELTWRLVMAVVFGLAVALIYRFSHGRESPGVATFCTTLVLLSVLIAMVSIVIDGSIARAFSLVGALSIVRFRTVVEDTRDTAFVIFAVIVGMASGTNHLELAGIGSAIIGVVAFGFSWPQRGKIGTVTNQFELTLRFSNDPKGLAAVTPIITGFVDKSRLVALSTVKQGTAMEYTYFIVIRDEEKLMPLVSRLQQLDGIQSIEIKNKKSN